MCTEENGSLRTEIWYRMNPTTGGTPDIVVTPGGTCTDLSMGAVSLKNVDTAAIGKNTYYFDGSDTALSDVDGVWTKDSEAGDGDTGNGAETTNETSVGPDTSEITMGGTNAPATGDTIIGVRARVRGGQIGITRWGDYKVVTPPGGSWTWAKVQALEVSIIPHASLDQVRAYIYADGDLYGTALAVASVDAANADYMCGGVFLEVITSDTIAVKTATGTSTAPTLSITTVTSSSYAVDSLSHGEMVGTKIGGAHNEIHVTDVGGDTHGAQYVNAGGAGAQTMNYTDTDADQPWSLSAMSIAEKSGGTTHQLAGTVAGIATVASALVGTWLMAGAPAGVATPTGLVTGTKVMAGTSAGAAAFTSVQLRALRGLAGTSAGIAAVTAELRRLAVLAGQADGLSTPTGLVTGTKVMAGTSAGLSTPAGELSRIAALAGAIAGIAAVTGNVTGTKVLAGQSDGLSTPVGDLTLASSFIELAGDIVGVATPSAELRVQKMLAGTAAGLSTPDPVLTMIAALSGQSDGVAAPSAELRRLAVLAGAVAASSTPAAGLNLILALAAASAGVAGVSGNVTGTKVLAGQADGVAAVSGNLTISGEESLILAVMRDILRRRRHLW
jgi:hypothetical protein